ASRAPRRLGGRAPRPRGADSSTLYRVVDSLHGARPGRTRQDGPMPRRKTPDAAEAPEQDVIPEDVVALPPPPPAGLWSPDVLGAGFEARTLPLLDDDEGEVGDPLVRHRPADDPHPFPGP